MLVLVLLVVVSLALAQEQEPAELVAEVFPREASRQESEASRMNLAQESRMNLAQESEASRMNLAQESEASRMNLGQEAKREKPDSFIFDRLTLIRNTVESLLPRANTPSARATQDNAIHYFMCIANVASVDPTPASVLAQRRHCGLSITSPSHQRKGLVSPFKCWGTLACDQTRSWMQRRLVEIFSTILSEASQISNEETRNLMMQFAERRPVVAQKPAPGFFGATAMFVLVFLVSSILFILSLFRGLWRTEKRLLVPFLGLLVCAALFRTISWTLVASGYQRIGFDPDVIAVPAIAVRIMERIGSVLFMILFAFFCWFLMDALLDSFVDRNSEKKSLLLKIAFVTLTGVAFIYGLAMVIISALPTESFTFDASYVLFAGITFFYCVVLETSWIYAYRHVDNEEMKRNSLIFAVATGIMVLSFAAWFVVSMYWTIVDSSIIMIVCALELLSQLLISWAIILYIGVTVHGLRLNPTQEMMRKGIRINKGYVPLNEDPNEIPAQYADF